jgi:hypothetical protein
LKTPVIAASIAALALAGCTTTGGKPINFREQLAKSCNASKPVVEALRVVRQTGGMSDSNAKKFDNAYFIYDQVCDGTVTDFATAATKAAVIYVTFITIAKQEK